MDTYFLLSQSFACILNIISLIALIFALKISNKFEIITHHDFMVQNIFYADLSYSISYLLLNVTVFFM